MHLALNFQRVDPAKGGAETYVADLCRNLVQAGHRVDLYAESWADRALPPQVNTIRVASRGRTRLERNLSFARNSEENLRHANHDCSIGFINTWFHDVIIPQGGVQKGSLAANAARFSPLMRPLYLTAKKMNPKYWVHNLIERRQYALNRQPRVIAVSNLVKRDLLEYHRVPIHRIYVVPNAIDPRRLEVSQPGALRCALRNRTGIEPGDLVGLFAGHNFALKGLKPLLEALGERLRLDRGGRPIHLLVCGGGDTTAYRRLSRSLGLAQTVHFIGFYPHIEDCYWSSDFFVQPTYYDPCSLVVMEALACGLPVITTAKNGASEMMENGREGFVLSEPEARGELVAALEHMTDDRARLAMSAKASALGRLQTFDIHVARLIAIFEEVAAAKSRRAPHSRAQKGASEHSPFRAIAEVVALEWFHQEDDMSKKQGVHSDAGDPTGRR